MTAPSDADKKSAEEIYRLAYWITFTNLIPALDLPAHFTPETIGKLVGAAVTECVKWHRRAL